MKYFFFIKTYWKFDGGFASDHYCDVIMGVMVSQITSLIIVNSTVHSGTDQRKHQSSVSLAFVRGIHRGVVNSLHKWPATREMFPFDDIIMYTGHLAISLWLVITKWSHITVEYGALNHQPNVKILKWKCGHIDEIFVDGGIINCHFMEMSSFWWNFYTQAVLILGLRPANERWRYFVTTSLIGWAQAQNQTCTGCTENCHFDNHWGR